MKVLLCATEKRGGVSAYCRIIADKMPGTIDYFVLGRRDNDRNWAIEIGRLFRDYYNFYKHLLQHQSDIVHLNPSLDFKAILRDGIYLLISRLYRRKVIVFIHGWVESFEVKLRKYGLLLFRPVYNNADTFVVLSSEFRTKLAEMGIRKKTHTVTTIVGEDFMEQTKHALNRQNNSETERCVTILFLSRIERDKGIYESIDAFRILRPKMINLRLTVAGDGSELRSAKAYVKENQIDGISFAGWVEMEKKIQLFLQSDIYLFPTNHGEGIPLSVLEAMAAGLPVITRPMGGIRDFYEDEKMGILVGTRDPMDIAHALERLIADTPLRLRIGAYNHAYARNHFSASIGANRLKQIYQEVFDDR
jgi:glycosyltransferase involved in cell wall biosynthesis